jgi:N-acetylglucosamine kinase-like BadF-type ATPase
MLLIESGATKATWFFRNNSEHYSFETAGIRAGTHSDEFIRSILLQGKQNLPESFRGSIACYASGCLHAERRVAMTKALESVFPDSSIEVWSDLHAAARCIPETKQGYCAILGTGSVGFYWNGLDVVQLSGGKGFPGGDTGGGADIGYHFVQVLIDNPSLFSVEMRAAFEPTFGTPETFVLGAKDATSPATHYGRIVPFIRAYRSSVAIQALLNERFTEFFRELLEEFRSPPSPLTCTGSVAHYFETEIKEAASAHGIFIEKIAQSPMDCLKSYHFD